MRPKTGSTVTLAELLLEESTVVPWQLQDARNYQERKGGTLARALVRLGFVKDEVITDLLGRQYGLPSIDLDPLTIDPAIIRIVPEEMARTYRVLPLSRSGATLTLAMADPTNRLALDDVRLDDRLPCRAGGDVRRGARGRDRPLLRAGRAAAAGPALAEACAKSERTAWQYVTAMHAAALGGARRPIRGLVEDVEDMRVRLTRERDEARARVAELERRLAEATAAPPRPDRPPSAPPR